MLYRQVKYFVAVVDTGSFTEAAEQCYISQSAISQQIQALESEMGVQLLVRGNRRFSLTPAGEHFYHRGKAWLAEADRMQEETVRIARSEHPMLCAGYLSEYSGPEFHLAVAAFAAQHPEVDIRVASGTHEELYDMLRLGKADLVLSDPRRAFSEDYVNLPIYTGYCYAELSTRHAVSEAEQLTMEQLRELPCILIASKEQRQTEQAYYQDILGIKSAFLFAANLEEARILTAGGKGYLPLLETKRDLPQMGASLRRVPLYKGTEQLRRSYYAFWKKDRATPLIEEFASLLSTQFSEP